MKFVQLTMVTGCQDTVSTVSNGEDDGLDPVFHTVETTSPVMVNLEEVRNFYPRKPQRDGSARTGTRITFKNGSGMAVVELFQDVRSLFAPN